MTLKSTFGLVPQRVASLLAAGSGDDDPSQCVSPAEAAGELLRTRLARPLPLDEGGAESLPAVLGRSCEEMQALAERTVGDVLLDSATPLAALETLREYGKVLSDRWCEGPEYLVAGTVYFAATARALVSHDRKLTARSYGKLAEAFETLVGNGWLAQGLVDLFATARTVCESKEQ